MRPWLNTTEELRLPLLFALNTLASMKPWLNTTEDVSQTDVPRPSSFASMKPWLNTTEDRPTTCGTVRNRSCFNEAVAQHHGGHGRRRAGRVDRLDASMKPWLNTTEDAPAVLRAIMPSSKLH